MTRKAYILIIGLLFSFFIAGCDNDFLVFGDGEVPDFGPSPMEVLNDELDGLPIVVAATKTKDLMISFKRTLDGEVLNFYAIPANPPIAFMDDSGTIWDIFGKAVSGKHFGKQLDYANTMVGFWFSFATFFPGIKIYPSADPGANEGKIIKGTNDWGVPANEVRDGGPGKDGIPAIDNPKYISLNWASFMNPDDLVVGFFDGKEYKAFPHKILNWHEIVNDKGKAFDYSIIYCPLTGTATAWSGNHTNTRSTFGVSGLLYNSNIIPYDRITDSFWSQIKSEAIYGAEIGTIPDSYPVVETSWSNWKKMYPDSKVLSTETGYSRDYNNSPYGNYNNINADYLIFPVRYGDNRLPKKQRVLNVNNGQVAKAYLFGLEKHK